MAGGLREVMEALAQTVVWTAFCYLPRRDKRLSVGTFLRSLFGPRTAALLDSSRKESSRGLRFRADHLKTFAKFLHLLEAALGVLKESLSSPAGVCFVAFLLRADSRQKSRRSISPS